MDNYFEDFVKNIQREEFLNLQFILANITTIKNIKFDIINFH